MAYKHEDSRGKKVVFVANCLLNANSEARGYAHYPGICKEFFNIINKYELGIIQLPCPETLYLGVQRWWGTAALNDNPGYHKACRAYIIPMVDYMESFIKMGYKIVGIIGSKGSASCGSFYTNEASDWGGCPNLIETEVSIIAGKGTMMEELNKEILDRGIQMPQFWDFSTDDDINLFEEFIKANLTE